MKTKILYIAFFAAAVALAGCDENEAVPSFRTLGTATHTMADITVSNEEPQPGEQVTLLLSYVNPSSDPLTEISVRARVGDAEYVEIQKFSVPLSEADEITTKTIVYVAPATAETSVDFDMVISSGRDYPQIQRTSLTTK